MITRAPVDTFAPRLDHYRRRVDAKLAAVLQGGGDIPARLLEAMRYSVLGGGKRVRPLLVYASGELNATAEDTLDAIAAAVELIHAYSLVHDDLPAMDDDDLRRGRPTTHRQFDEATAILAGDALQALAFEVLASDARLAARPQALVQIVAWLARAAGPAGMVGGQSLDMEAEGQVVDERGLERIHRGKTGALIRAAIMMPSELGRLDERERASLDTFASEIGLVFQIRDDLLEVEQDTATLGKSARSDAGNAKSTYPSTLGIDGAKRRAAETHERAVTALRSLGERANALLWLSDFILTRQH
ncbi:MAG TPA: farnesyl diphosphate synthase [Gammaproteobacteria bacterium]|nr:farnesyl diphosphate synthase [Gammaproteobacteria bacterium]